MSDEPLNDSRYGHQRSGERIETLDRRAGGQCIAKLRTVSPHASDVLSACNDPSDAVFQMQGLPDSALDLVAMSQVIQTTCLSIGRRGRRSPAPARVPSTEQQT